MTENDLKKENDDSEVVLTKEILVFVRDWIQKNSASIPSEVLPFLIAMIDMCEDAQTLLKHNKKLVELLRQHMGYIPTKERDGKKDRPPEFWNKKEEDSLHKKMQKARDTWRAYKDKKPKKKRSNNSAAFKHSNNDHDTESDVSARPATAVEEPMFLLPVAQTSTLNEERPVDRNSIPANTKCLISSWQSRRRYNVSLLLTTINYQVETVQDVETGFSSTAKVDDGPARFKITWDGIAQIVMLVVGMCIPMVRLASCLGASAKYFDPSRIYRICLYAAHALFGVYREIFNQMAQCSILSGDDTNNSVIEMRTDNPVLDEKAEQEREKQLNKSKAELDPQKISLLLEAEDFLGSQMPTKNGKEQKKSIFTTVVIGERPEFGSQGTLVFYHSERKSFGDVIGKILHRREQIKEYSDKLVTIQSDLSSSNIPNPMPAKFSIDTAGCAAHARRPFWRNRKDVDPQIGYHCYTMLLLFDQIFDRDREARAAGKSEEILRSRKQEQLPLWNSIRKQAEEILQDFAPNSPFAKDAEYIINNFAKLTKYIANPQLRPDNNRAERLLRFEKTMLDNSKFRVTKRGRLVYDILRTILATCSATKVSPFFYIIYVLKNQFDARQNPKDFTPLAYATKTSSSIDLSKNK